MKPQRYINQRKLRKFNDRVRRLGMFVLGLECGYLLMQWMGVV